MDSTLTSLVASCDEKLLARAEKGDPRAQEKVADHFLSYGRAQNPRMAFFWLTLAAERGRASAQRKLGLMRLYGIGRVQPDVPRGVDLLEQAAKQGDTEAKFILGNLYVEGRDVPKNMDRGLDLLFDATLDGHELANLIFLKLEKINEELLTSSSSEASQGA